MRKHALLIFSILLTIAVYAGMYSHQFIYTWDDIPYVTGNKAIQTFSLHNLREIFTNYYVGNYAPVQMLSYMLDHAVWGMKAGGFLYTNLILHCLNGFLFYILLLRLHGERLIAGIAVALFLLHPVQVETVAWVSQRKNLLAMFFFLAAWLLYQNYRESGVSKGKIFYVASVVAFALSVLSKSVAVILPVALILSDFCFPVQGQRVRWLDKLPYVILSGVAALIAMISQQNNVGGGITGFHGGTPLTNFYTMLPVFVRYLQMVLWPSNLSAQYIIELHKSFDVAVFFSAVVLVVLSLLVFKMFRTNRKYAYWAMFFFLALLPVSQIIPLVTLRNDRYLYFPMLGCASLAGCAAACLWRFTADISRRVLSAGLILMLCVLGIVSYERVGVWHDQVSLWNDAARKNPGIASLWAYLGEAYYTAGDLNKARTAFEHSLKMNPLVGNALLGLGVIYSQDGRLNEGLDLLETYLEISPLDLRGWGNLGHNLLMQGNLTGAENAYQTALACDPEEPATLTSLANLARISGRYDDSRKYYSKIEIITKKSSENAFNLAILEATAGNEDAALGWLAEAAQRGYSDSKAISENRVFAGVVNAPRFSSILEAIQKNAALETKR